jgi:hypothetical protein
MNHPEEQKVKHEVVDGHIRDAQFNMENIRLSLFRLRSYNMIDPQLFSKVNEPIREVKEEIAKYLEGRMLAYGSPTADAFRVTPKP